MNKNLLLLLTVFIYSLKCTFSDSFFIEIHLTIRIMCIIIYIGGEEMTAKEIIKILLKDGWTEKNCKGSHKQFVHPTKSGKVTVPYHTGDLDKRTVKSILNQAGL